MGLDAQMGSTLSRLLSSRGFVAEQVTEKHLASGGNPKPTAIVLSVVDADMPALNALVSAREWSPPIPVVVLVGPDQGLHIKKATQLTHTQDWHALCNEAGATSRER